MDWVNREQLLSPISGSEPSGANLEHDPAFAALENAAKGKPEQRMGNSVVPGEPPNWSRVLELAVALLQRTHDLRIVAYLSRALLQRHGFPGFGEGLALTRQMLEQFWATLHPMLDDEKGEELTERTNALAELCAPSLLAAIRSTPVVRTRGLGAVCLQDIHAAAAETPTEGNVADLSSATIEAIFREVELEQLEATAAAVKQSMDALRGMDAVFESYIEDLERAQKNQDPEQKKRQGPDLSPLVQVLHEASAFLVPRLSVRRSALTNGEPRGEAEPMAERGEARTDVRSDVMSREIRSREDVVRAIDGICAYYARSEPTSPLPHLLERCKRLATSSFLDIIRDLAPDSLPQVERLGGTKPG